MSRGRPVQRLADIPAHRHGKRFETVRRHVRSALQAVGLPERLDALAEAAMQS